MKLDEAMISQPGQWRTQGAGGENTHETHEDHRRRRDHRRIHRDNPRTGGFPRSADQGHRRLCGRRLRRLCRPPRCGRHEQGARPADHHREQARRVGCRRGGNRGALRRGRLHAASGHRNPGHRPHPAAQAAVQRRGRSRAGRADHRVAVRRPRARRFPLQDPRRVCRPHQGQSRRDEVRLAGRQHDHPSRHRAVRVGSRPAMDAGRVFR